VTTITKPDTELQDWVNANMSHLERVIVYLIACASKEEVSRLRVFLDEWDDEGFVDAWRDQLKPRS
jgi:hypothetical protein